MYWLSVPRRRSSRRGSGGGAGARVLAGRTSGLPGRRAPAMMAAGGARGEGWGAAPQLLPYGCGLDPASSAGGADFPNQRGRGAGVGAGPGGSQVVRTGEQVLGTGQLASRAGEQAVRRRPRYRRQGLARQGAALASTACTPGHGGSRRRECGRASGRDKRMGERRRCCTIVGTGCGLRRNVDSLSGVDAGTLLPNGDVLVTMGVTRTRGCLVDWCSADRCADRCLADRCLSFDRSLCRGGLGPKRRRADGIDVLLQGALLVLLLLLHRRRRSAW